MFVVVDWFRLWLGAEPEISYALNFIRFRHFSDGRNFHCCGDHFECGSTPGMVVGAVCMRRRRVEGTGRESFRHSTRVQNCCWININIVLETKWKWLRQSKINWVSVVDWSRAELHSLRRRDTNTRSVPGWQCRALVDAHFMCILFTKSK